tara:strand:- start:48 stop:263 length:216 start_codon:yes stop_codon:yes gene_type:complete
VNNLKEKCSMCIRLETQSCPICNKQTTESWRLAVFLSNAIRYYGNEWEDGMIENLRSNREKAFKKNTRKKK